MAYSYGNWWSGILGSWAISEGDIALGSQEYFSTQEGSKNLYCDLHHIPSAAGNVYKASIH